MAWSWWQLPGPTNFIESIARDVADGKNVVLCLPHHAPSGQERAVRAALADWDWERIEVDPADPRPPIAQLYARFVPAAGDPRAIRNAGTFLRERAVSGQVFWLEGLDAGSWPAWSDFLTEYAHAGRASDRYDHSRFCVALVGEPALRPPPTDTALTVRRWNDVVDELDMLLFSAGLIRHRSLLPLQKRLAAAVIAQVAAWDPEVGERLAAERLARILAPEPVLRVLAADRQWQPDAADVCRNGVEGSRLPEAAWLAGMAASVAGEPVIHSAALVALDPRDPDGDVERRVWHGQVGVLLPFVEERRRWIVESFAGAFRLPHYRTANRKAPIREARDLEIGHIYYQIMHQGVDLGLDVRHLVTSLKTVRDCLAHLQPLHSEPLLDSLEQHSRSSSYG